MTKILFPYIDQPIRFPFYVNDLVYIWEVGSDGIKVQLLNNQIDPKNPLIKDITLEDTGISFYLVNEEANTSKHIIVDFDRIGIGFETLGILDPLLLRNVDPFTLGDISIGCADAMRIITPTSSSEVDKDVIGLDSQMKLDSNCIVQSHKNVYPINLNDTIGMIGLYDTDYLTLGDLDSRIFNDIDLMLSVFRVFHNIPAQLVKEIRIRHNNRIDNEVLAPYKDFSTGASGIAYRVLNKNVTALRNVNMSASCVGFNISISGKAENKANVVVSVHHQSHIDNGEVTLDIQSDNTTE